MATKKENPDAIEEAVVVEETVEEPKPAKKASKKAEPKKPALSRDGKHGGKWDIMEKIFVPRGNRNEAKAYFVSINGRNFNVPKGKTIEVPVPVANAIKRTLAWQTKTQDYEEEVSREARSMK